VIKNGENSPSWTVEYFKLYSEYEKFSLFEPGLKYKTDNDKYVCEDCFEKCQSKEGSINPCQEKCGELNKWSKDDCRSFWVLPQQGEVFLYKNADIQRKLERTQGNHFSLLNFIFANHDVVKRFDPGCNSLAQKYVLELLKLKMPQYSGNLVVAQLSLP
jgi:hypothetical protein